MSPRETYSFTATLVPQAGTASLLRIVSILHSRGVQVHHLNHSADSPCGVTRALSGRSHVLIRGRRYPVTGLIAMDQMVINCGLDEVTIGDRVGLIGTDGDHAVTAAELADLAGTIVDEIFCGISSRVPRTYVAR